MQRIERLMRLAPQSVLAGSIFALSLGTATMVAARDGNALNGPLVLKAQGSFYVGGRIKHTHAISGTPGGPVGGALGSNEGDITVDQMYVQYEIPEGANRHVPVVMLHGCCLSGKTWETTPDGRMGWEEYFAREHHAVYIPDQVSRARSGFDATSINKVRLGIESPNALPSIFTVSHQAAWGLFRFGPTFGTPFPGEQFPVKAVDEFGKQVVPDLNALLPENNPTYENLAALARQLHGAVLMGHSESGFFPEQAALVNAHKVKGLISIEGSCSTSTLPQQPLTSKQIASLSKIPILVIFGDHLMDVPEFAALWQSVFNSCQQFVQQIDKAGGDAIMMYLPERGIYGNSHMLMQDKNNLQVADLILKWINQHVE